MKLTGSYPGLDGSYEILVTPTGTMTVHSSFKYSGAERYAREIGLGFSLPKDCDTLHWERNAEWSVYPKDHIGRPIGTTKAVSEHAEKLPPTWPYAEDNTPMGTNDFRSTKRHIRSAWIGNSALATVGIRSDGKQALRAMVDTDRVCVYVNDWFGGTNVGWGEWITNYGKGHLIKSGDVLESTVRLSLYRRKED